MQKLPACPVCQATDLSPYISCQDFTVSHETFHLESCQICGFVMTNPRPDQHQLHTYYQSEQYISHSNKANNIVDQIYKLARAFTLNWKFTLINKYSLAKPTSLLDFGCGTGDFLQRCQQNNMSVAGVEPSPIARASATKKITAEIHSALDSTAGPFDVITLWHVLEHVIDLNPTLDHLKNLLPKNGTMFIAVPNLNSYDAGKYREYWAAYDVPRHLWHFSRTTMARLLRNHQLNIVDTLPMRLDAYYVSLLSQKYQSGKTNAGTIAKAFLNGWRSNEAAKQNREFSSLIYLARK